MAPTIGIVTGVDSRMEAPRSRRGPPRLVLQLADRDPTRRFVEIDWRTICSDGSVCGFDARARGLRLHLSDLELLHVLRLGYPSRRNATLREKWNEFAARLETVRERGLRCINAAPALLAGMDKAYLLRLREMGFPIVPTIIAPSTVTLPELSSLCPFDSAVVKPLNGECGRLVRRLIHVDFATLVKYRDESDHIVLQPFLAEIARGERSLIFIAGRFSHAVLKVPTLDFRANGRHTGARVLPYTPSDGEIELCLNAGTSLGPGVYVFRVDLIATDDGPLILEVETVDPGHYAVVDDAYVRRLGDLYEAHLREHRRGVTETRA